MKDSVDFCDNQRCLNLVLGVEANDDCASPHLPSHDILKLRTAIHPYREFGEVYRAAQSALKRVRGMFADLAPQGGRVRDARAPLPQCLKCSSPVSLPCWYCVECKGM